MYIYAVNWSCHRCFSFGCLISCDQLYRSWPFNKKKTILLCFAGFRVVAIQSFTFQDQDKICCSEPLALEGVSCEIETESLWSRLAGVELDAKISPSQDSSWGLDRAKLHRLERVGLHTKNLNCLNDHAVKLMRQPSWWVCRSLYWNQHQKMLEIFYFVIVHQKNLQKFYKKFYTATFFFLFICVKNVPSAIEMLIPATGTTTHKNL